MNDFSAIKFTFYFYRRYGKKDHFVCSAHSTFIHALQLQYVSNPNYIDVGCNGSLLAHQTANSYLPGLNPSSCQCPVGFHLE
jgi:hypothetical protein